MPEHGTRTMYVHYGCRCEECCKAEHRQYLKRKEARNRRRTHCKWETDEIKTPRGKEAQRLHNRRRYRAMGLGSSTHTRPIAWRQIAEKYDMKCAICGCKVDPGNRWTGKNGRTCFGGKYPTVDHIIPLKHGGTDTFDNVQLTCKHCNSVKGDKV